mgnify:CR=1 FL=1
MTAYTEGLWSGRPLVTSTVAHYVHSVKGAVCQIGAARLENASQLLRIEIESPIERRRQVLAIWFAAAEELRSLLQRAREGKFVPELFNAPVHSKPESWKIVPLPVQRGSVS